MVYKLLKHIWFECKPYFQRVIMAKSIVLSLVVDVFIKVLFVMVVFVIVHCRNMHNIAPHEATAAEALISSSAVVQEGSPKDL